MTASHDIPHTPNLASNLVAGPRPVVSAVGASKPSAFDRFSTPLWISVGISTIGLAVLAALI
jgi:hypothetical protein